MNGTVNVRVFTTKVNRLAKGFSYTVRWKVDGQVFSKTYKTSAQANTRRSQLVAAEKKGELFSTITGLPATLETRASGLRWYDFAVSYVDGKWPKIAGNTRKNLSKAMTTATLALLRSPLPGHFDPVEVRTALREWAFNAKRRADQDIPGEVREILDWVQRNTLPVANLDDEDTAEEFVTALGTLLNGKPAAASSISRNRRIMNPAMEHAVKRRLIRGNPLPKGRGESRPSSKAAQAIDKRSLLNVAQCSALLTWVGKRSRMGRCYRAFFATLYYAGLRPEEAVGMLVSDATLPEEGWGELLVHTAQPEVGSRWTDTGEVHEERGLKGRAEGDTRPVPAHPTLVAVLRDLIEDYDLKPGDILFQGEGGGMLAGSVYRRVWGKARKEVLPEHECASPVGKRVYDLRHTCLTGWLNSGIPPAQVAAWAGNSVPVLHAIYARCVTGQLKDYQKRIEAAQGLELDLTEG
ncbi:tyrosine-type recombinase/integrase [Streptomyces sp. NPDC020965]|uniref:tyrosine-type recombinase/integrase n=1 Tax=Streptomyces sp. NPDC020965 TaxID=3365105 RepID=UPI00379D08D9